MKMLNRKVPAWTLGGCVALMLLTGIFALILGWSLKKTAKAFVVKTIPRSDVQRLTGWLMFSRTLVSITDKPVYAVQLVVIGPDGKVLHETARLGIHGKDEGTILPYDGNETVTVGLRKNQKEMEYVASLGSSAYAVQKFPVEFSEGNFGWLDKAEYYEGLVFLANDGRSINPSTREMLREERHKVFLKLITDPGEVAR